MSLLSTIIPWAGGSSEPLKRTIDSVRGISDEVVVVHQKMFDDDTEIAQSLADKVCVLDWNAVFQDGGFAVLPNAGAAAAKGPWMLFLGVGETVAQQYVPMRKTLESANPKTIFRCDHVGDIHTWGRLYRPDSGTHFGGPIHESCGNGVGGPVIFRMQDFEKERHPDIFRNECIKWWKTTSYNVNYAVLIDSPEKLSFTDPGWLSFVKGARESIEEFLDSNKDLVEAALDGDRDAFFNGVKSRMDEGRKPDVVNFNPTGQPMSEGALPSPA